MKTNKRRYFFTYIILKSLLRNVNNFLRYFNGVLEKTGFPIAELAEVLRLTVFIGLFKVPGKSSFIRFSSAVAPFFNEIIKLYPELLIPVDPTLPKIFPFVVVGAFVFSN